MVDAPRTTRREKAGVESDCEKRWMGDIGVLYDRMKANPLNEDWDVLAAQCLVRKGLAPPGFDAQDYRELKAKMGGGGSASGVGQAGPDIFEPQVGPTLPSGVNMLDPEVVNCRFAPLD